MKLVRSEKRKLTREAYRLARETFDSDVAFERLVEIRDRLARIDRQLYGPSAGA